MCVCSRMCSFTSRYMFVALCLRQVSSWGPTSWVDLRTSFDGECARLEDHGCRKVQGADALLSFTEHIEPLDSGGLLCINKISNFIMLCICGYACL